MKTKYIVIKTTYGIDVQPVKTYGIGYAQYDGDKIVLIQTISDITQNFESIRKLTELCNSLKLEPLHLNDIIEDYISS